MFLKKASLVLIVFTTLLFSQKKVACIGNSITAGSLLANPTTESYPSQLQQLLGSNYVVYNYGSAYRVLLNGFSMSYQNSSQFFSSLLQQYDIIVICLGTNDTQTPYRTSYGSFTTDYKDLISQYDNSVGLDAPICIVGIPPPIFSTYDSHSNDYLINEIIPRTKTVANQTNSTIANFYNALKNKPEMFIDGVHPTAQGAGIMAQVVKQAINDAQNSDIIPPAIPNNFSANGSDGKVELTWSSNSESDLHHYNIFRGTTLGGFMNYLSSPSSGQTMYTDNTVVNGTTYYYQISAIDNSNNASARTSPISVSPGNPADITPPSTPLNFFAAVSEGTVTLSWDANIEPDLTNYNIYRGIIDGGWKDHLATVDKITTTYIDYDINSNTVYFYQIDATDNTGNNSERCDQISATTLGLLSDNLVKEFSLYQNTPNPFNPTTNILYTITKEGTVSFIIYDMHGRQISQLTSPKQHPGNHSIKWNGTDHLGNRVPAGIYFYQLKAGDFVLTKKMVLMK